GNGMLLPAGPLREPVSRLHGVDAVVVNGGPAHGNEFTMHLEGNLFYNLLNPGIIASPADLAGKRLHAIAGIGHPQRFFTYLEQLGLRATPHPFPDHHRFNADDISFDGADAILMTEKDAVKCGAFATERCWALRVDALVSPPLTQLILKKVTP
ncbi:MAG: tetraacyldisaccharide 4'-kinase, partial [Gallionellaceae bacterium]|nr:tetraacyldisaccharide 4'-kinase [Gallionellaceae bacterium]